MGFTQEKTRELNAKNTELPQETSKKPYKLGFFA